MKLSCSERNWVPLRHVHLRIPDGLAAAAWASPRRPTSPEPLGQGGKAPGAAAKDGMITPL